ncbi:MAG: UPF0758 family protein [Firmicutes bacterium]|nr:UPF0758 family protein [Bacillota bacterium]MDI6706518.1 DNA repair protein RadC [Bacillota bacterium]
MESIKYHLTIKELPETERPREKLCRYGSNGLTDAEILAILIGTGSRKETALDLAAKLINDINNEGGLRALLDMTVEELSRFRGMGTAKACKVLAAAELARRIVHSGDAGTAIRSPQDAAGYLMQDMRYLKREHFKVMLLNIKNHVLSLEDVSIGSLNTSIVHPREIFKMPIKKSAAAILLAHNHPSGDPTPSQEDINITRRICEAGKIIGIDVLDHIIIGDGRFTSLKEKGII